MALKRTVTTKAAADALGIPRRTALKRLTQRYTPQRIERRANGIRVFFWHESDVARLQREGATNA